MSMKIIDGSNLKGKPEASMSSLSILMRAVEIGPGGNLLEATVYMLETAPTGRVLISPT